MGRGRAKAKQTKVARRLKYYSPDTDLTALERELKGSEGDVGSSYSPSAPEQDQYIAEHYGRNRHRDPDNEASTSFAEGSDGADSESGDDDEHSTPRAAQPITPGSWMKKRA